MEAAEGAEVRPQDSARDTLRAAANGGLAPALSGQSYWLDVWLMLLFDLLLFVFVYLLP